MFLDLIQQLWSVIFFQPYTCDLTKIHDEFLHDTIKKMPLSLHNLHAHTDGKDIPSFLFVTCTLNEVDMRGIRFVLSHQEEINNLIAAYS